MGLKLKALERNSNVPDSVKDRIFEKKKQQILDSYAKEDDNEIVRSIRLSNLGIPIKRMLIEERVNKNNIFVLLSEYFISKDTIDLTLEVKKDLIRDILNAHDNNKLFTGKFDVLSEDVIESMYASNEDLFRERISKLNEDELYDVPYDYC